VVDIERLQYTSSGMSTDHLWSQALRASRPPRICVHGDVRTVCGGAVLNLGGEQHPIVLHAHNIAATTVTVPPSTGNRSVQAGCAWGAAIRAEVVSEKTLISGRWAKVTWRRFRSRRHEDGPSALEPAVPIV
jgi:hypothetical protein